MPKRTFWLITGVAVGAGSSLWAERKVRRTVHEATARLQPDALVAEVGRSARHVAASAGDRVRDAVSSGRQEMLRREEELWADLATQGARTPPAELPGVSSDRQAVASAGAPAGAGVRAGVDRPTPGSALRTLPRHKSTTHLGN